MNHPEYPDIPLKELLCLYDLDQTYDLVLPRRMGWYAYNTSDADNIYDWFYRPFTGAIIDSGILIDYFSPNDAPFANQLGELLYAFYEPLTGTDYFIDLSETNNNGQIDYGFLDNLISPTIDWLNLIALTITLPAGEGKGTISYYIDESLAHWEQDRIWYASCCLNKRVIHYSLSSEPQTIKISFTVPPNYFQQAENAPIIGTFVISGAEEEAIKASIPSFWLYDNLPSLLTTIQTEILTQCPALFQVLFQEQILWEFQVRHFGGYDETGQVEPPPTIKAQWDDSYDKWIGYYVITRLYFGVAYAQQHLGVTATQERASWYRFCWYITANNRNSKQVDRPDLKTGDLAFWINSSGQLRWGELYPQQSVGTYTTNSQLSISTGTTYSWIWDWYTGIWYPDEPVELHGFLNILGRNSQIYTYAEEISTLNTSPLGFLENWGQNTQGTISNALGLVPVYGDYGRELSNFGSGGEQFRLKLSGIQNYYLYAHQLDVTYPVEDYSTTEAHTFMNAKYGIYKYTIDGGGSTFQEVELSFTNLYDDGFVVDWQGIDTITIEYPLATKNENISAKITPVSWDFFLSYQDLTIMVDSQRIKEIHACLSADKFAWMPGTTDTLRNANLGYYLERIARVLGISVNPDGSLRTIRPKKFIKAGETIPAGWYGGCFGLNNGGSLLGQVGGLPEEERDGIVYEIKCNNYDPDNGTIEAGGYALCENWVQYMDAMQDDLDKALGWQELGAVALPSADNTKQIVLEGLAQLLTDVFFNTSALSMNTSETHATAIGTNLMVREVLAGLGLPLVEKIFEVDIGADSGGFISYPGFATDSPRISSLIFTVLQNLGFLVAGQAAVPAQETTGE